MADKSETVKMGKKLIKKIDKLSEEGKIDELIEKVTKLIDNTSELVSSPEAKNFFKNVTEMMKGLSGPKKPTTPPPKPHTKKR